MKVVTLFDDNGKVHALFRPASDENAPVVQFRPAAGHVVATLDVPAELQQMKLGKIHAAVRVDLGSGSARLVKSGR